MNASDTLSRVLHGSTDSVYLRLWQHNRCNFRDYQNIAVNGRFHLYSKVLIKIIIRNTVCFLTSGYKELIFIFQSIPRNLSLYVHNELLL